MEIRKAREIDIPSIQAIARTTWQDTYRGVIPEESQKRVLDGAYSVESLTRSIKRPGALLVAEATVAETTVAETAIAEATVAGGSTRVVGFADVGPFQSGLMLYRLYVLPDYQGRGIGRQLLEQAIDTAAAAVFGLGRAAFHDGSGAAGPHPVDEIVVSAHVERDNPKARAFYLKMGFIEQEEETETIEGIDLPVILISRKLTPAPSRRPKE